MKTGSQEIGHSWKGWPLTLCSDRLMVKLKSKEKQMVKREGETTPSLFNDF